MKGNTVEKEVTLLRRTFCFHFKDISFFIYFSEKTLGQRLVEKIHSLKQTQKKKQQKNEQRNMANVFDEIQLIFHWFHAVSFVLKPVTKGLPASVQCSIHAFINTMLE